MLLIRKPNQMHTRHVSNSLADRMPMVHCRGLETKLKHCLVGSNIFADETEGIDPKQQVRLILLAPSQVVSWFL